MDSGLMATEMSDEHSKVDVSTIDNLPSVAFMLTSDKGGDIEEPFVWADAVADKLRATFPDLMIRQLDPVDGDGEWL